ncbi:MAG: hypothetical protein QW795_03350 [Candidatus Bathyarchaeia archaeon]
MKIEIYDIKEFSKKDYISEFYLGGLWKNIKWQFDLTKYHLFCYTDDLIIIYDINNDEMKIYLKNYKFLKKILKLMKMWW